MGNGVAVVGAGAVLAGGAVLGATVPADEQRDHVRIYLYQGEELGLQEVPDIPTALRQDPVFFRSTGIEIGRDGCRVPLPWTRSGLSFGFGDGPAHLPQPAWFADYAVDVEDEEPTSTLNLYRRALALRSQLRGGEALEWIETDRSDVLAFRRPGGWISVTNFGTRPLTLPTGEAMEDIRSRADAIAKDIATLSGKLAALAGRYPV